NGDGIADFVIGALWTLVGDDEAGVAYVVFGRDTGFPAEVELSSLQPANGGAGSAGFVLTGVDDRDRTGESVSAAGDVNGDGVDDLIIGAPYADVGGNLNRHKGQAYVVFGRDEFPAVFPLATLLPAGGGD